MNNVPGDLAASVSTLTVGCGGYDRTWPLAAAVIKPDGYLLDWNVLPPEEVFLRGMLGGEFDITEMSLSTYMLLVSRGESRYRAIPAFVSRKFRHGAIYVRAGAGVHAPEDLRGRAIGVPEYQLTANLWARGMLSDEYGVKAEEVIWVIGGIDEPGRVEKVPLSLPDRFTTRHLEPDRTLWDLMMRGEIDAMIGPRAPKAFTAGDPRIVRLFADVPAAEKAYFQKTGLFPLMHVIGVRQDCLDRDPSLGAILLRAFEAARQLARREMRQSNYDAAMLPWLEANLQETIAVLGEDYWPYGLAANLHAIETACRYAWEQGITDRRLRPEDLFAE